MKSRVGNRGPGSGIKILAVVLFAGVSLYAQSGSLGPEPGSRLEVEPIRCWRQATSGAVTIGEPFRVILTCAVFESPDAQVVPDESRLTVAAIQMAPFEIVGGTHPPDVRRGLRRFLQYEYDVRIISRDAIGQDVNVPPLTISYRIHSRVGPAAKLEGRDLSYLLPALPIKVLSLVPADAADIRDAAEANLAAVDALRARSRVFESIAIALGMLAAAMALVALVPLARRAGGISGTERHAVPDRAIVASAVAALRNVRARAGSDAWTDEVLAAALSAVRVIGAVALDRVVSRKPLPADGATPEGRLRVEHGLLRRRAITVSSAVTMDGLSGNGRADRLRSTLLVLTQAMYGQSPERDAVAIDNAVGDAITVGEDVAAERSRLRQGFGARGWLKSLWVRR